MEAHHLPEKLIEKKIGDHCLLCGAEPVCLGIFVPDDPVAWGGCKGKTRFIRYCLCSKCQGREDTPDRVEKIIRADLTGGGMVYAE
jgi:hypothetical protein